MELTAFMDHCIATVKSLEKLIVEDAADTSPRATVETLVKGMMLRKVCLACAGRMMVVDPPEDQIKILAEFGAQVAQISREFESYRAATADADAAVVKARTS